MTVKTRSSVNDGNHIPSSSTGQLSLPTNTTTNSSSSNINIIDTLFSNGVESVLSANDEATQQHLRSIQIHLNKQFLTRARQWLTMSNFTSDEIDEIMTKFNIPVTDEPDGTTVDDGGCAVLSPVKKKQKSNGYGAGTADTSSSNVIGNHHQRVGQLPPKPSTSSSVVATTTRQLPCEIVRKYDYVAHGLSQEELTRVDSFKKNELIRELDLMGGEYHKSWKKSELVDSLLQTHASHHQQASTQMHELLPVQQQQQQAVSSPRSNVSLENGDNVVPVGTTTDVTIIGNKTLHFTKKDNTNDTQNMNVDMAQMTCSRTSADNNFNNNNVVVPTIISIDDDDRMSVTSIAALLDETKATTANAVTHLSSESKVLGELQLIQQVASEDSGEADYESAKQMLSQSQQHISTSTTYSSNIAAAKHSSSITAAKLPFETSIKSLTLTKPPPPQQPRISPTKVPPGTVDSAKKLLLQSSANSNSAKKMKMPVQRAPHGAVVSTFSRKLYNEHPTTNTSLTTTTNPISNNDHAAAAGGRMLSTPAFNGSKTTVLGPGMSDAYQANLNARQAHVARMKEKSKQTLKNTTHGNEVRQHQLQRHHHQFTNVSSTTVVAMALQKSGNIPIPTPKPAVVDTIESKPYTFKHTYTKPSPVPMRQPEFTNYEITDDEYDSNDEDDSDDSERNQKLIPDWARSANLQKALEIQFSADYTIDPDEYFGEVETCNLEAIFEKRSSKYRIRTSSGDWTKDRVTEEEKRSYKEKENKKRQMKRSEWC